MNQVPTELKYGLVAAKDLPKFGKFSFKKGDSVVIPLLGICRTDVTNYIRAGIFAFDEIVRTWDEHQSETVSKTSQEVHDVPVSAASEEASPEPEAEEKDTQDVSEDDEDDDPEGEDDEDNEESGSGNGDTPQHAARRASRRRR